MKIQLWRNATVLLKIGGLNLLIDPMLGQKSSLGAFPWTKDIRLNPLVDLPFTHNQLKKLLNGLDAVVVTHLHPDHWDGEAIRLLDKNLPVICPSSISKVIKNYGFKNVIEVSSRNLNFNKVNISLTSGLHGKGEIEEKMGEVYGFVFSFQGEQIYFAGDTILCEEVITTLKFHKPEIVVVAGGAATFEIGPPVTMSANEIVKICRLFPKTHLVITHLESISTCKENRLTISKIIEREGVHMQCVIPKDGEEIQF